MSRLLLVEDDEAIADLLCLSLQTAGHQVQVARDGLTGVASAQASPPDLVLLDMMLPGIDGVEVCRRLRRFSSAPVLMLSASDAGPDRRRAMAAGAADYIVKPFALRDLLARVDALSGARL